MDLEPDSLRGQNAYFDGCVASFVLSPDETIEDAFCLESGITQLKRSARTQAIWNLTVTYQFVNWATLQVAFDEIAQTISSITLPKVKSGVVDSSGEIIDAEITAGNQASVKAYVVEGGEPQFLISVVGAPASANEFQADGANTKLVFDASLEGQVVSYVLDTTYTSIDTIGEATSFDRFGKLQFSGILGGTEFNEGVQIVCHQLNRTTSPELNISEAQIELTVEYRLGLPAGRREVFSLYNLDTAA